MFASTNAIGPDTTGSGVTEESEKTCATYTSTLSEFRHLLGAEGLDLDAADPCQARALPALSARIPDAAQQVEEQHPRWVGDALKTRHRSSRWSPSALQRWHSPPGLMPAVQR